MTDQNKLHELKTAAKRLARSKRISHHQALDEIAQICGQPHWNKLTAAYKSGWRPSNEQEIELKHLVENGGERHITFDSGDVYHGKIDGHPYELRIGILEDVLMGGEGWCIHLGHAPSEPPTIEKYTRCAIDDPALLSAALKIAHEAADRLRAWISSDWPRRSTKPDADGRVVHPLWSDRSASNQWYCLHCDGVLTGNQLAENMWHCPNCNATPIDISPEPFWKAAS